LASGTGSARYFSDGGSMDFVFIKVCGGAAFETSFRLGLGIGGSLPVFYERCGGMPPPRTVRFIN
jgi:hypothetical protein